MSGHVFWVEVLGASKEKAHDKAPDRAHEVVLRQRFQGSATIGRGYSNDVVLDDPLVAADHLRISEDEGGHLWVEDLGTVNGSIANIGSGGQEAITRLLIAEEANLTVGHTRLRIRTAAYRVPAETPASATKAEPSTHNELATVLVWLAALISIGVLITWLAETGERKFSVYVMPVLMLPLIDLVWAGSWAMVTRIVTSRWQFYRHAVIVLSAEIAFYLADKLARFSEYSFAWPDASRYETPLLWIMFAAVCFFHLRLVVPRRPRLIGAIVTALAMLAIVTQGMLKAESEKQYAMVKGVSTLMPPYLRLRAPRTADAFFSEAARLQPDLEIERKKEPSSGPSYMQDID